MAERESEAEESDAKDPMPEPEDFTNPVAMAADVAKAMRERGLVCINSNKASDEDVKSFLDAYETLRDADPRPPHRLSAADLTARQEIKYF